MSPGDFLSIVESTGLAPSVDLWVVRRGVEILAGLPHGFRLSLNISGHSMGHPRVRDALLEAVAEHEVDARHLVLEVTETVAVSDMEEAREFAASLADAGVRFALDDFGQGYGSFSFLRTMEFDFVKIDGEFVREIDSSAVDLSIVRAIVKVSHELGKQVVAEFVSTPEVLEVVRAEGVDYAQGYEIGRPVPMEEFRSRYVETSATARRSTE